jgi:hypothetical protein
MTYEEAKEMKIKLDEINQAHSDKLKEFDQYRNGMGLVPDNIRELPEYQKAKNDYNQSFQKLRNFNGWFVKEFRKKNASGRKNRFKKTN